LDPALREDVRLGLLSATVVRELVRLPRGNQARAARAIRDHGLSSRQAGRLVRLLLGLDPQAQEAALKDPLGYSMQHPMPEDDPEPWGRGPQLGPLARQLRTHLLAIRTASRATLHLLSEPLLFANSPQERRRLAALAGTVLPVAKEALAVVETQFQPRKGAKHVGV
jgi:hypothetical protein